MLGFADELPSVWSGACNYRWTVLEVNKVKHTEIRGEGKAVQY